MGISNFQEKYKTSRISFGDSFEVPEFDPVNVVVRTKEPWMTISWGTPSLATAVDAESVLDREVFHDVIWMLRFYRV